MFGGKKNKSELILFKNFKKIQKEYGKDSTEIIKLSIINSSPFFNIKKIKRKRKNLIEFPFLLNKKTRIMYSFKKLTDNRTTKNLYSELIKSANQNGQASLDKDKLHKEAFIKKKTANYRWFY